MANETTYLDWYFKKYPTEGFSSGADLLHAVGGRPHGFMLTRMDRRKGGTLTQDNFLWVTKSSIAEARKGILDPPRFPVGWRTDEEQALNDWRFTQYAKGMIEWHQKRVQEEETRSKLRSELELLLSHITDYVISKGYSELDAMNPEIIPDNLKLQKAREKAVEIMGLLSGGAPTKQIKPERKAQTFAYLAQKNKEKREHTKMLSAHNRVHSGKPGRPVERWINVRVPIVQLTAEQRKSHNPPIPPYVDHIYLLNPDSGKMTKRRTVLVPMANPKAQQLSMDKPPVSSDTRIDNV